MVAFLTSSCTESRMCSLSSFLIVSISILVSPFKICYTAGNGPGEIIRVICEQRGIILVINKSCFHQNGGHRGVLQHDEVGPFLQTTIHCAEALHNLRLNAGGKLRGRTAVVGIDKRFCTAGAAAVGIAMQTDEYISRPCICCIHHTGQIRCFPSQIITLQELHLAACRLQICLDETANRSSHITFPQSGIGVHRAAVPFPVMPGVDKYTHYVAAISV
nr:MAG TPA_asm: hypothetical protein [Caudoviricetes sp.]